MSRYTVGVDFGTLSGRAVVVDVVNGTVIGTGVHVYQHGVLSALPGQSRPLPADWALQVPDDYRNGLRLAVPAAIQASGVKGLTIASNAGISPSAASSLIACGRMLMPTPTSRISVACS